MDDNNSQVLALCMWMEGRGSGAGTMFAIGCTIINRAKAWGKSIFDVVYQHNAFSWTRPDDPEHSVRPKDGDAQYEVAKYIAGNLIAGADDVTKGALYYANESNVTSGWYKEHIMTDAHPTTLVEGYLTFRS